MAKGSHRQIAPGKYEVRVYVPALGRHVSRTFTGSVKARDAFQRELVDRAEAGEFDPKPYTEGSVADIVAQWIDHHAAEWSARHLHDVRWFTDRHLASIAGMEAAKVTPANVRSLYGQLARDVGVASARRAHTFLNAAYTQAVAHEELPRNPCAKVRPPKAVRAEERDVSFADVARMIAAAEASPRLAAAGYGTLIWVAATIGARRGELCGLQWQDINVKAQTITIRRAVVQVGSELVVKGPKSGKPRTVTVDAATLAVLERWRAHCDRLYTLAGQTMARTWYIWPTGADGTQPTRPDMLTQRWDRLRARGKTSMRFHDIRHANASFLAAQGADPADAAGRLGHGVPVFMGTYVHASGSDAALAALVGTALEVAVRDA